MQLMDRNPMLRWLICAISLGGIAACHTATERRTEVSAENDIASQTACYRYVNGRDTVHLRLVIDRDSVNGTLHFRNYQVDGSSGSVSGRFRGDTLVVFYDFFAEGMHSVTEEAFLVQGDTYIRGFGERQETAGIHRFIDSRAIDFSDGQAFHPVPCAADRAD
ncbi:hypothetical protein [Parapedobacter lycopersici]|uniref:hypothetical protein n=1 Tax=Parapedobacter lycopersici TaxID=1864939 RepID=UPI003340FEEC